MTKRTVILVTLSCLTAPWAVADTILLSNGDRVSGAIVNTTGGKLVVKTEFLGEVTVDRKGVASINADKPLTVTFESGETVVGTVATENREVRVTPENRPAVVQPLASLAALRDADSQRAYEREQRRLTDPGWMDFWVLTADLGLATAQGNSETTTFSTGLELVRATGFDKTVLGFTQIYSTQRTTEPFGTTANRVSGRARYDRDITKKLFAFGAANFDFDEFQDLDLRSVLGGGLGWHILRHDRHTFDFSAGGNWNREQFSTGFTRDSGEIQFGEESTHKVNSRLNLFQAFTAYPNLSTTGEYRFNFDAGADLKLTNLLSLGVKVSDRFLSNPIPGNQENDILFTTGVHLTWAQ